MTSFTVEAVVPTSDNIRPGYVAAPAEIANWVTFNTGNTILIDPNSKATVNIVFKIPSGYRKSLPKNWQFDLSFESNANPINTTAQNGQTINIQTQYLFRWLISMK